MDKWRKTCVVLLAAAVALILLPGCADNRSPAEKLMGYIAKNGGSGSVESSVGVDLPVKDAGASCDLKLSNAELEIGYVAPQDGIWRRGRGSGPAKPPCGFWVPRRRALAKVPLRPHRLREVLIPIFSTIS